MKMKKTEYITYRTDKKLKDILSKIAAEKKWTVSFLSEEIIREWLKEKHPELMTEEWRKAARWGGLLFSFPFRNAKSML